MEKKIECFDIDKITTAQILETEEAWAKDDSKIWPSFLAELVDILADHMETSQDVQPDKAVNEAKKIIIVIAHHLGGRNIYLPRDDKLRRAIRDTAIYRAFDGQNHRELAQKSNLTTAQIYNIINRQRRLRAIKN